MAKDLKDSTERKIDNMLILIEKLTTKTFGKELSEKFKRKRKRRKSEAIIQMDKKEKISKSNKQKKEYTAPMT
jgi:hypothetical protein